MLTVLHRRKRMTEGEDMEVDASVCVCTAPQPQSDIVYCSWEQTISRLL